MSNFVLELPLITEKYQEDIIDKRLETGRIIYNSLLNVTYKRYKEMKKTKKYRNNIKKYNDKTITKKEFNKNLNDLRDEYKITEYDFHKDVKKIQNHFKGSLQAQICQKIASYQWKMYLELIFKNRKKIDKIKKGRFNYLESKSKSCILLKEGYIRAFNTDIKYILKTKYEKECFKNDYSYCRIIRKNIRNKKRYFLQIIFKGKPINNLKIKKGIRMGIDLGLRDVSICTNEKLEKIKFYDGEYYKNEKKIKELQKYISNSKIKNKKLKSKRCIKKENELREIYRKIKAKKKYEIEKIVNYIISMGEYFYIEEMSFYNMVKKSDYKLSKTIQVFSPNSFIKTLERKLSYLDIKLIKINTIQARASQFNHVTKEYKKKELNERLNIINGKKIDRDLYSAFLIMNIKKDLKTFDLEECEKQYSNFLFMYDKI